MKLTVREVQAQDAEALAELSGQLGYASTTDELHQRIEALMKGDDHCVFVALDAEKVIGWTHGFYALRLVVGKFRSMAVVSLPFLPHLAKFFPHADSGAFFGKEQIFIEIEE